MNSLRLIVEAHSIAKALAVTASQSLFAVDDVAQVQIFTEQVLPSALSTLEGATCEEEVAAECVQDLSLGMGQLQSALLAMGAFQSEGVLGVLMEHPGAWLDLYRSFRGLTASIGSLSALIRTATYRHQAEGADEALQNTVKAFMAICARARDAANLLGSDLPEFARAAAEARWTPERLSCTLTTVLSAAASTLSSGPASGPSPHCSGNCSPAATATTVAAACGHSVVRVVTSTDALATHSVGGGGGSGGWSILRLLGKGVSRNSAGSSPGGSPHCVASPDCSTSGRNGAASLDDAALALMARIRDNILYDSEVDQLEQDRAYLLHRIQRLREFRVGVSASKDAGAGSGAGAAVVAGQEAALAHAKEQEGEQVAAAASLVQSEVLLAAVDARLAAMHDLSDSAHGTSWRSPSEGTVPTVAVQDAVCGAVRAGCSAKVSGPTPTASGRLTYSEDLHDDVRNRHTAIRWLAVCFVGA